MLQSVQYLRGLAALMVVLHHLLLPTSLGLPFSVPMNIGASGVDMFFVISGFVIAYTHARASYGPAYFLYRRVIRVAPLYWILTGVGVSLHLGLGLFSTWVVTPATVTQSLLFLPFPNPTQPDTIFPLLEPGWTLIYEMFFYALFTLAILLAHDRAVWALTVVLLALVGVGLLVPEGSTLVSTYTDPLLLEFVAGMLIARWLVGRDGAPPSPRLAWLLIPGLAGWAASAAWTEAETVRSLAWGLPATLVLLSVIVLEHGSRIPQLRWLHEVGDASYSIYLTHIFTLAGLHKVWGALNLSNAGWPTYLVFLITGLTLSTAVGMACYHLLERPVLHGLRRVWRPHQPAVAGK